MHPVSQPLEPLQTSRDDGRESRKDSCSQVRVAKAMRRMLHVALASIPQSLLWSVLQDRRTDESEATGDVMSRFPSVFGQG